MKKKVTIHYTLFGEQKSAFRIVNEQDNDRALRKVYLRLKQVAGRPLYSDAYDYGVRFPGNDASLEQYYKESRIATEFYHNLVDEFRKSISFTVTYID